MAEITVRNVRKSYGRTEIVHGVDLDIHDGEFIVILGPSGCGKSTLLRMVAGLETITSGEISISGKVVNDIEPRERGCAMVFQNYALYPHMNVAENIGYSLKVAGVRKAERMERIRKIAEPLGLIDYLDRRPAALSGGQRQRVAMGRAMIREPKVFLFDEPLSNLDARLRVQMRAELRRLHQRLKTTSIFVTHDQVEAMTLADKIVVLRSGNIEQVGAPLDLYDDPANQFVAGFVGSPKMNFLRAEITNNQPGHVGVVLRDQRNVRLSLPITAAGFEIGEHVTLGIRPEHFLEAGRGDADLTVDVDVAEHLGNTSYIYANIAGGEQIVIEREESRNTGNRDTLTVALSAAKTFLFDSAGNRLR